MKSAPTIAFDYRPSRRLGAAAAWVCAAAVFAPWLTGLPPTLRAVLASVALAAGIVVLRRYWRAPFRRIAYRASGWLLIDASGEEHPAILESHAHLGAWVALGFHYGLRARFRVILAPDNLDVRTRRRLILLLARADVVHAG